MTTRPVLTLKTLLLASALTAFGYVAVLGLQLVTVLVPTATELRGRTRDLLADHDRITENLGRLHAARRDLSRLAPPFVPGAPRPDRAAVRDTVLALLDRGAAMRAAIERADLPLEMRLLLADAASIESAIAVQLLDAERAIATGNVRSAIDALRLSGIYSDSATNVLSRAQRTALADVLAQQERLLGRVERLQRWTLTWAALGVLLFALGFWLARRRLYLPIREMERTVQRVARGDLGAEARLMTGDELGRLAEHVNAMTAVLRERAAEETRRRESLLERFGRILDESANEIFVFDANTRRLLQANRGAREGLGYDPDGVRGLHLDAVLSGITPERLEALIADLRTSGQPRAYLSAWLRRRDGSLRATELVLQYATDADADVLIVVAEDARVREQLRTLDARLREFVAAEAERIASGDVSVVARKLVRMVTEAVDADFAGLWRGSGERAALAAGFDAGTGSVPHAVLLDEVLAEPGVQAQTLKVGSREAGVVAVVRRDRAFAAEELSFLSAAADVAMRTLEAEERRGLERALEQAQRIDSLGQLAGGVAHDFNNLLTAILGNLEATRAELPADSPIDDTLAEAQHAALRAADLTRQLLTFARRQVIETRAVQVGPRIEETEPMLRRLVGPDRTLVVEREAELGSVRLGSGQLEQLLVNLVVNARDATPAGGRITLAAKALTDDGIEISVHDTGVGMDAATLERVFEPFFTTKGVGEGTGLGLAVCHGIVAQAGGSIRATSVPGQGSTFTIRLPVSGERASPTRGSGSLTGLGGRVLVAEDEPAIRTLVSRMLTARGFQVQAAEDGRAALAMLDGGDAAPLTLLLTDVVMPRMGGVELAREVRRRVPGVPVLFMSGYASSAVVPDADLADASFLAKPFSADDLSRRVAELLGSPSAGDGASR